MRKLRFCVVTTNILLKIFLDMFCMLVLVAQVKSCLRYCVVKVSSVDHLQHKVYLRGFNFENFHVSFTLLLCSSAPFVSLALSLSLSLPLFFPAAVLTALRSFMPRERHNYPRGTGERGCIEYFSSADYSKNIKRTTAKPVRGGQVGQEKPGGGLIPEMGERMSERGRLEKRGWSVGSRPSGYGQGLGEKLCQAFCGQLCISSPFLVSLTPSRFLFLYVTHSLSISLGGLQKLSQKSIGKRRKQAHIRLYVWPTVSTLLYFVTSAQVPSHPLRRLNTDYSDANLQIRRGWCTPRGNDRARWSSRVHISLALSLALCIIQFTLFHYRSYNPSSLYMPDTRNYFLLRKPLYYHFFANRIKAKNDEENMILQEFGDLA